MALYVVTKANNRFKQGTYFEEFDWGVQEAVMKQDRNKLSIAGNRGFVIPKSEIEPYVMRVGFQGRPK